MKTLLAQIVSLGMQNTGEKRSVMFVRIRGLMEKKHFQVMARTVAVSRVFRAVIATTVVFSSLLAVKAIGGVLRSAMGRVLGIGVWATAVPVSTDTSAATARITVFLFVA